MKKKIFISSILLIFSFNLTFACSCASNKSFLKTISKSKVVALIKVNQFLSYDQIYDQNTAMSMEVEVIELYKGNISENKIKVWGDNGALCRPYLDTIFEEGKYYIVGLFSGGDGKNGYFHKDETTDDFAISSCGQFWLYIDIDKNMAYGIINSNIRKIGLEKLKKKLFRKLKSNKRQKL